VLAVIIAVYVTGSLRCIAPLHGEQPRAPCPFRKKPECKPGAVVRCTLHLRGCCMGRRYQKAAEGRVRWLITTPPAHMVAQPKRKRLSCNFARHAGCCLCTPARFSHRLVTVPHESPCSRSLCGRRWRRL
jgi:hypothetical protein